MSHTTKVTGVQIMNITALQLAVANLIASGAKISLVADAKPRAYFQQQDGMTENASYVIKVEGANSFDVGLYLVNGCYEPRFDVHGGTIAAQLGAKEVTDRKDPRWAIGKLLQEYQIATIMQASANNGNMVERRVAQDGNVNLVITGY